jgi:N-acyl-phosphatidylethanolamine-hydrolysing phospholipase D
MEITKFMNVILLKSVGIALILLLNSCKTVESSSSEALPAHHTKDGFKNLYVETVGKSPYSYLKMKYFGDDPFADQESEAHLVDVVAPNMEKILKPGSAPLITWVGHSTFLIQYQGINILTDPIFSERASPLSFAGPKRLVEIPLGLDDLPEIDFVIISHNHYDHLDIASVSALGANTRFLVPLKLKDWFVEQGISAEQVVEFDWWDQHNFSNVKVSATPSQHWSARGLFDRNKTLWASWHVEIAEFTFWFAGDTGYNPIQFKEVGERFKSIDLGLIPIGAYAPKWFMGLQHVNPEEALSIHRDIGASKSLGMHWGTFPLTAEPIMQPKKRLELAMAESNLDNTDFEVLSIGQTIELDIR